jgi:iron complex outermembrane receptor protein
MSTRKMPRGAMLASRCCTVAAAVAASLALLSPQAFAQTAEQGAAASEDLEEIVVTGTSIRGAAPVGTGLITVGREEIESTGATTVQQILEMVPAVTGMGTAGQGNFGSADASGVDAPTIHGLGASASNSTLILIDGHRFPLSGINHALGDPNMIPPLALERVEVLADGASSIYGSDAVAGVINFITRKHLEGFEAQAQYGFADNYKTYSASGIWGHGWDGGSILAAYGYSDRSALNTGDRSDFTRLDHRSQGGTDFNSFNCSPATIQPAGQALIFTSPYTGAGLTNVAANAPCDYSGVPDILPSEQRNNVFVRLEQDATDKLHFSADVDYSNREDSQAVSRGTLTATAYGPGDTTHNINPFYTDPAGSTATSQTVRWDANQLLGPGARSDTGAQDIFFNGSADYKITNTWTASLGALIGTDISSQQQIGVLCGSCANLALNGTTNSAGNLSTLSVPGTTIIVTQPLTTANALDLWHGLAGNLTSQSVLNNLRNSTQTFIAHQNIDDVTLKVDGSLFAMPAGDVKLAVGGEYIKYVMHQDVTRPLGIGPATTGSSTLNLTYNRNVKSEYAELLIPIVGGSMSMPGLNKLDLSISGRHDDYSDFGGTSNPKFALDWVVVEGVKIRGNYAKSFVAPALTSRGNAQGITAESSFGNYANGAFTVPYAAYPTAANIPGCPAPSATVTGCTLGTNITGALVAGGNGDLKPQTGNTWSVGTDLTPSIVPDLKVGLTWWHSKINGAITAPSAAFAVNAAGLNNLLTVYPTGATAAQLAAQQGSLPLTSALPNNVYYVYNFQQRNALNLVVNGIDGDIEYLLKTGAAGNFNFGLAVSDKLKFQQQVGTGGPWFSVLNTTGLNTTFPSVRLSGRANVGWRMGPNDLNLFVNYTGSYKNWSGTPLHPIVRVNGVPVGGGDDVSSLTTVDLHDEFSFAKFAVYVDVQNLLDKDPPFYNSTAGWDSFQGNPIGRLISIGARKKL